MRSDEVKRNSEVQNLRAIAAICILIGHMPIALPNFLLHGYTFVSLFLTFTGYFAAKQFCRKYSESTPCSMIVRKELTTKFFRLVPLMWIWILIYFFVGNLVGFLGGSYGNPERWLYELKAAALLYYNYYLAGLNIGGLFGQYWTLFVEIHFHILFLVLFLIIRKDNGRRYLALGIILLTVFVFRPLTNKMMVRYSTQAHLDALFAGVYIAMLKRKPGPRTRIAPLLRTMIGAVLVAALFLSGYVFDSGDVSGAIKYTVYTALSATILLLADENAGYFSFGKIIDKYLLRVGNASASIYVCHVILFSCIYYNLYAYTTLIPNVVKSTGWGVCLQVVGLIVLACAVGYLSYSTIEKPYIRFSKEVVERIH